MTTPLGTFRRFGDYPHRKLAQMPKRDTEKEVQYGGWKTGTSSKVFGKTSFKGYEKSFLLERITKKEDLPPRPDPLTLTSTLGPPPPEVEIEPRVLTPEYLLEVHRTTKATEIYSSRLTDEHLVAVQGDFSAFTNITHMNCSDNDGLNLDQFEVFPTLTALQLAMNALTTMVLRPHLYKALSILDLSYNTLSHDSLVQLARLPHLTALDLTGNELTTLPLAMSGFSHVEGQPVVHFAKLDSLILDRNELSGPAAFAALAGLPRLRYVSMTHNQLGFIPHLVAAGSTAANAFPSLAILNLSHNPLLAAEDVLEAALFPAMQVLIIAETPLVRATRVLPAAITAVLVEARGIRVVTHERKPKRPPIRMNPATMTVVGPALPRLPNATDRVVLLPALPPPAPSEGEGEQVDEVENEEEEEGGNDGPRGPGFFMTELDDDDDDDGGEEDGDDEQSAGVGSVAGARESQAAPARASAASATVLPAIPTGTSKATPAAAAADRQATPPEDQRKESILFVNPTALVARSEESLPLARTMTLRACDLPFEELLAEGDADEQRHRAALQLAPTKGAMAAARALEFALHHPNLGASRPPLTAAAKEPRKMPSGPAAQSRARTRAQQLEQTLAAMRLRAATVDAPLGNEAAQLARPSGSAPVTRESAASRAALTSTSMAHASTSRTSRTTRPSDPHLRTLQVSFNAAVVAAVGELAPAPAVEARESS
eukprot:m.9207 g.9207  ORF g.9207 m.9207 type:complete len:716 (+) comp5367_c0_seq1:197-2344(+)